MTRVKSAAMAAALVIAAAIPLTAHHSFSAEYDVNKPVHIEGKVVKVSWGNPHVWVDLTGKDGTGAAVEWRVEASAPAVLQLLGWNKDTVLPGMDVRVGGYPSKMPGVKHFGSTNLTIVSSRRVLKTPACWAGPHFPSSPNPMTLAEVQEMISKCPVPEVP